jgi:tRNA A-37 threonylcarbamoyl transferase component Bud32
MPDEALAETARGPVVALEMPSPRELLELPGVVVSGHVGRNVSRVTVGDETAYLKREHRVRWRDRLRSLLDGFGFVSVSEREYRVIRRLREHGLPAPQPLARGEVDTRAFLLLAEADGAVELQRLPRIDPEFAAKLGQIIAEIHNAGVDQPDLFAKHFLVDPSTGQITILDWQRATLREVVPWRNRVRSLAAFRATCSDGLLPPASWQAFLDSYVQSTRSESRRHNPPWARDSDLVHRAVNSAAAELRQKPSIRSQLIPPKADQQLVRIGGERVCVIPPLAGDMELPGAIASLYDPANNGRTLRFRAGRVGTLTVARHCFPLWRWAARIRGKPWRSPELRTARLLFHLERYGIPAPRLLAYGQMINGIADAGSFVLAELRNGRPIARTDAEAARELLARLHDIGCCLRRIGENGEPLRMDGSVAIVGNVRYLRLNRRLTARQMARDHHRLDAFLGGRR